MNEKQNRGAADEEAPERLARRSRGGRFLPYLIAVLALMLAALALQADREHTRDMRGKARLAGKLKMASTLEHIEEYMAGVHSDILYISLDPDVKAMTTRSRTHIQALFDHQWARHRLAEVYVIERDFDGEQAPFMTFEYESAKAGEKETHSLEYEEEEYEVQMEQIQRFLHEPYLTAMISSEVSLCLEEPENGNARGFVYSVPIRRDEELVGIVASMIPSDRMVQAIDLGNTAGSAFLVSDGGEFLGSRDVPAQARTWFGEHISGADEGRVTRETLDADKIGDRSVLLTDVGILADRRWWLVYLFDEDEYLRSGGLSKFLYGKWSAAGILLAGVLLALLVKAMSRRYEDKMEYLRERQRAEAILRSIVEGTSGAIGEEFFRSLVRQLALTLDVGYVFVGQLSEASGKQVRTLAFWEKDRIGENFTYDLAGSPCEGLDSEEPYVHPRDVGQLFPEDALIRKTQAESFLAAPLISSTRKPLGLLAVLDDKPMLRTARNRRSLLAIFAARAAAELERIQAEEQRVRLAMAIDQAAETILITDADGRIEYVNPSFQRVTGYASEEVLGKTPAILKSDKHDQAFYKDLWDTIGRGDVWTGRFTNRTKQGGLIEEEATISGVRSEAGVITHYVAVKRDVTHEARLEDQLRQAQKMEAIGTLAGGIAHDFNNILYAILGYTDLAIEDVPEESMTRANLDEVIKAAKRAADLVNQILAFSRQTEQERRPMRLQPVAKEALKLLRGSLPATIEIERAIDESCGPVHADPTQIHQVIMNLCTNAYQAMRDTGGVLRVSVEPEEIGPNPKPGRPDLPAGPYVRLTVADTGHGMDAATRERIFEPYFTTKDIGQGTGLGLATVHGIVKSHHGAVSVESEPDKGSTFRVYLPVCSEEASTLLEDDPGSPVPSGSERVLFVDDEEPIVRIAKTLLERLGYEVSAHTGSLEALADFRAAPESFDVVITDQTMPQLTGIELSRRILEIRPDMPIILCTGFSETVNERKAKELGIREYVRKPIVARTLSRAIQNIVAKTEKKEAIRGETTSP